MIGAGLPSAWCFSTQMKGFQDVFLKSVTNHSIQFHFLSEWLVIDIFDIDVYFYGKSQCSQI